MEQPKIEPPEADNVIILGIIAVPALAAIGYFFGKLIDWIFGGIFGFLAVNALLGCHDLALSC